MSKPTKISRQEIRMATAAKITGPGKKKYFRYVWAGVTVFWWLLGNLLLRRELVSAYEKGFFVIFCWGGLSLLASVCLGYLSTKAVWLNLTRVKPEGTRRKLPEAIYACPNL